MDLCNCQPYETIPNSIQWPRLFVELEVPTIGPHTSSLLLCLNADPQCTQDVKFIYFLTAITKMQCNCVVDFNKGKLSIYWKAENVAEVTSTPLHFGGDTSCTLVYRSTGNCKYSSTSSANPWLLYKVSGPNLVAYLNWTPIFEWHVVNVDLRTVTRKISCVLNTLDYLLKIC